MQGRQPEALPEHAFPVDPWRLVERRVLTEYLGRTETLFALGNGYLGLRGNTEEGRPAFEHGTVINGLHETWAIQHAEEAYGFAKVGQTIVEAPDPMLMKLYVDDEPLFVPSAHLLSYERVLDLRTGVLTRDLMWETPAGKQVSVRTRRLVSLRHRHLAAFDMEVCVHNADAPITVSSQLLNREDTRGEGPVHDEGDPRRGGGFDHRVFNRSHLRNGEDRIIVGYKVTNSLMTLGAGIDHLVTTDNEWSARTVEDEDLAKRIFTIKAKEGQTVRIEKLAAFHTAHEVPSSELCDRAARTLDRAIEAGFDLLADDQAEDVGRFWERADIRVGGDDRTQQAVRWSLFQLMCASERADTTGIPAKGVSGLGYEGHYFWDIEIYVMPFLCYTQPRIARNLLRFRHSMLDHARARAAELGHSGALYPWRTITGDEASAYYQAGTAQYHLDADIVFALKQYIETTGDLDLLTELGAELLIETARMWSDLGFYDEDGAFHLHAVTGPDEYTTVVNDNAFTNMMAAMNLRYAADVVTRLAEADGDAHRYLIEQVRLGDDEVATWRRAAQAMHIPYDERRGINPQDEHFLERKVWPFETTPPEHYPLLLHYHPLVIYRHQVIKQADIVLAMFLLGDRFSADQKRRNFDHYEPLTTSDSSLSPSVHSIIAAEVGQADKAMEHFRYSLFMDLDDVAGNAHHGVHVAATGGTWMALVYGFGGLRDHNGELAFDPRLPAEWDRLEFPLTVRGRTLDVEVTPDELCISLREGEPITVSTRGVAAEVTTDAPHVVAMDTRRVDGPPETPDAD